MLIRLLTRTLVSVEPGPGEGSSPLGEEITPSISAVCFHTIRLRGIHADKQVLMAATRTFLVGCQTFMQSVLNMVGALQPQGSTV